ncbi:MAG: 50S ribosomal protein L5 [Candidatus Omnitrophota bacterium]
MTPRLLEKYRKEIIPAMQKTFNYKNAMQVPSLSKIVVNMGVGEGITDIKIVDKALEELSHITGQKPVYTRAKKSISNFKVKENTVIGCKVTLRKNIMYEFLDRLVSVALPRIRDFRGVKDNSFDKKGNYTLGIQEQGIFPEIEFDKISRAQGMDITFVINNSSKDESRELLKLFGIPFKK